VYTVFGVDAVFRKKSRGPCGHPLARNARRLGNGDGAIEGMLICCSVAGWTYKAPFNQTVANREKYYLLYKSVASKRVDYPVHPSWWLTKKDFFRIKEGGEKRCYCNFSDIPARSRSQEIVAALRNTVTRWQDDFKDLQNKLLNLVTLIIQTGGL
jgi:hypothetical protein